MNLDRAHKNNIVQGRINSNNLNGTMIFHHLMLVGSVFFQSTPKAVAKNSLRTPRIINDVVSDSHADNIEVNAHVRSSFVCEYVSCQPTRQDTANLSLKLYFIEAKVWSRSQG